MTEEVWFHPGCFLAMYGVFERGPTSCNGQLRKCHLIPKMLLKQKHVPEDQFYAHGTWAWGCGGIMGQSGHHGMMDSSRTLRLPRVVIPQSTIDFAEQWGLMYWIERNYL